MMNRNEYQEMLSKDSKEQNSKYEPILKFSYTNPHKIIKPVSNKPVTRWSPQENTSYVEKDLAESKYVTPVVPESSPRYENISELIDDDSTYESIEYVDGVYKMKAAEPLVISTRMPHRAVTRNTFSHSGYNNRVMFSEMTYEERQEERRRLELGEEKGFPMNDYFARSEALKKNALSPTETHTRNNYSKWLLNELNKERNLSKLSEVRQKASVASAFREPQFRTATPTPPAGAAQRTQHQASHHAERAQREHISTARNCATEEHNTNGSSYEIEENENRESTSGSDSRSDSPFEFNSRRARFENPDSLKSEEIRSCGTRTEQSMESEPLYANAVQEEGSSGTRRKWDTSSPSRQVGGLPSPRERQMPSSSFVQDSTGSRYASNDHYEVSRDYHINERQGYIEKINENGDENIYDYPQMPPKPVEVRFSFQPENASKFLKTSDTSSLKTSPQNNRTPTKDIQFTDMHVDPRLRTDRKRANTPDSQRPYISKSEVTDYSFAGREEHSFASSQRALPYSQSRTHETSKIKTSFTSQDRSETSSQKRGTAGGQRAMSYDLQSARVDKVKSSQFSTASQNAPVHNDKPTNVPAKFSTTNPDAFYSMSSKEASTRKSRKDLFQDTHQEREEKLESEKMNNSSSVRQGHSFGTDNGKIKKHERKVSDMVRLFEELAQQQFLDEQDQKYGYDRIKSGSLNDVRTSNAMLSPSLYENELSTSANRSASCTQLYGSQAVEYNRGGPKRDSGATVGSLASQNKVLGRSNETESTVLQGTYKLFDDQKMSSYAPLGSRAEQAVKKVGSARPWTPERYISKELTSDSGDSVKQRSSRVAKTVVFNDDPPFFSTKTYSNIQTQQHSHLASEQRKSDKVKKFDPNEPTSSNFKNASSLHYSHDPEISAFEKYESWRTNLKANERGLNENRLAHGKNRLTFSQQPNTQKTLDCVPGNERHTSDFGTGKREASASRNPPGTSGENYYVSSTVTMTRRLPQRCPTELNDDFKICSTLTDKSTISSEKSNFRTTSSYSNHANAHSNISTAPLLAKRTQQSPRSPVPTSQTVTRLHSPVRESIFHQGMSRSSSKLVSETERQFGSSNQMGLSAGQDPSFRSSRALSNPRVRPRSQSADPEQSMRKASGAYGLEAFRVMSPGPAPHFVRMTEEARRKAEDYHVNSDQKLLNIFFDRLIEQHKYSSTSNLQAKRAIVEQSRFIRDSPKILKESTPNNNYSQSRQLTSQNIQEADRKQPETLQSSSLQRAAHGRTTLEGSERSFNTVVGSSGLNMSSTEKILSGQMSNFEGTTESHVHDRTTNSSRFQPGITYSDDKNAFRPGGSANYPNLANRLTGQPGMTESSDEAKVVGRFQVQKRTNESAESAGGQSPTPGFVNKEFSRYSQDMTNKNLRNIEKKIQPEVSSRSTSQFSVSNRDFSSGSIASAARIYSDNARKMPPQPTAESSCPPDPDYFHASSREYSSQEKVFSRDASERKSRGNLSYAQCSSNAQTDRKVPREYFHSQELSSFFPRSSRSSAQGHDRLLSPVAYSKTSRSEMAYSSPLNLPSRALSPASSLFTDDRNWSPRVQSPSQFNSVVNIQTLERSAPSPVAHNDSLKESNVLRFTVNNYDGASDIEARKQMYLRSLDADCTPLTGRVQSPSPQSSVTRTERA